MLLKKEIPTAYDAWNKKWGAPYGRKVRLSRFLPEALRTRLRGPFSMQPNSDTRTVEYPWAFLSAQLKPGMVTADIGGAFSGFSFVLDKSGANAFNVDPFFDYGSQKKYQSDPETEYRRFNAMFNTGVTLKKSVFPGAGFEDDFFDRIFCISAIEHMPEPAIRETLAHVRRTLKKGGLFVFTVDLFLDVRPFTDRVSNRFGKNVSIRMLVEESGLRLVHGARAELFGYAEFDPHAILSRLERYYAGGSYPVLSQSIILGK